MALRLSRLVGNSPAFWLNLQRAVDLWDAEAAIRDNVLRPRGFKGKVQTIYLDPPWNAPTHRTTRNESPLVMMVVAALEGGA